ncbi:MAG TPA: SMP-30/gluconolactonase/LRE family protein [Candidatus Dormibacteraeota bacterium]|nr:SMP-30/gluconolactonase/LRE family protein [Candidatus Dormibacteraeota bacterium]
MITSLTAECILDCRCKLGEGPVWNPATGALDFVDIMSGELHHLDPRSGRHTVDGIGQHIGAFAPRRDGGYVVAVQDGFGLIDAGGGAVEMIAPVLADRPDLRMNEGKCDPQGRFWAGTMAYEYDQGAGTLYRLDPDGSVHTVLEDVTISNGLDWTDDERTLYYIDSFAYRVDAFDYDAAAGTVGNRRVAFEIPNDDSSPAGLTVPDGMTLDAEGALWVAVHGAGEVRRYDPEGNILQVVTIPPLAVTSAVFGGEDLDELYITCAGAYPEGLPHDGPGEGGVFRCKPGVRGRQTRLFAG